MMWLNGINQSRWRIKNAIFRYQFFFIIFDRSFFFLVDGVSWKLSLSFWNEYSWFLRQRYLLLSPFFIFFLDLMQTIATTEERLKRLNMQISTENYFSNIILSICKVKLSRRKLFQCHSIRSVAFIYSLNEIITFILYRFFRLKWDVIFKKTLKNFLILWIQGR